MGEASDGLEALEMAVELRLDLILLDIGLPSLNGIDRIGHFEAANFLRDCPGGMRRPSNSASRMGIRTVRFVLASSGEDCAFIRHCSESSHFFLRRFGYS